MCRLLFKNQLPMKALLISISLLICFGVIAQNAPFEVVVLDFDNQSIEGEQILFSGINTLKTFKGITDKSGKFEIELPSGDVYEIKIKSVGAAKDYNTIEVPALKEGYTFNKGILTVMIEEPKLFTLDNVYFDSGKSTLKTSSYKELNELLEYLTLKSTVNVEIAGHTDNVGEDAANLNLSQKRAETVKKYLVAKGINVARLSAKGYGESVPVSENNSEKGRKLNRRTEVHIKS